MESTANGEVNSEGIDAISRGKLHLCQFRVNHVITNLDIVVYGSKCMAGPVGCLLINNVSLPNLMHNIHTI